MLSNLAAASISLPMDDHKRSEETLPSVLVIQPPPVLELFEDKFISTKFKLLKAWESPLPLDHFLTTHATSVRAVLSSGFSSLPAEILRLLPSLELVVSPSAGVDHIDLAECRSRGIAVTNAGSVFSDDGADAAVGLLMDVLRKISAADRYVRQGLWPARGDYPLGFKLRGKRVGIVGLGGIGSAVAKRLEALGCTISYTSRKKRPSISYPFYATPLELAARSDAIIICCCLTAETRHMIDREVMVALGKNGVIVNVARGAIIDEAAMVRCLVRGEISGAGLDVFESEPSVPKELLEMDNVVLSPHRAVFTSESFVALSELAVANLEAFFTSQPLLSPVTDVYE